MTIVRPGPRPLMFILGEDSQRSRDNLVLKAGAKCVSGQVMAIETATKKVVPLAPAGSGGAEVAAVLPLYAYDATAGDVMGAFLTDDATLIEEELVWPVGITGPQKLAALAQLRTHGLKVRPASYV